MMRKQCYFLSGDSSKSASCEFCGEKFRKTQSLASHARFHLRQLGVTDWTAHGSPMATLRKLMARGSCSSLSQSSQTTSLSPAQAKSPSEAPPPTASDPTHSRLLKPPSKALPTPAPGSAPVRVPKARKGSRMAVSEPKDEPVELDISQQSTKAKLPPQLHVTTVQSAAYHTTCPANQNLTTGKFFFNLLLITVNFVLQSFYCYMKNINTHYTTTNILLDCL